MGFASGSLVRARGREWVVLPESAGDMLILRPLGGSDDEITGIFAPLEAVEPAQFGLPDPERLGDHRSCRLLRDAARLGFRSSAGPFRSFARLAIEPRPYQLVPLLMALKLDPVRLLIADDVGIGKTIEAALIAREMLDRAEVRRIAVVCPPPLAEQWQRELASKFHIDAQLVLPSTANRLERNLGLRESLFERHPFVIVSMDFIKSDRRREEFLRTCPELVIVDEAHTCAWAGEGRSARHQRHQLLAGLAANPDRHLILVTATPHSGNENAFRSLLQFLNPDFAQLPEDLSGPANEGDRRRLAAHFVQRRRGDIKSYLHTDTPFPSREEKEESYSLSTDYRKLFQRVLDYARELVNEPAGDRRRQRVQWWSVLALLRAMASSPAAAAATLRTRAASLDTETADEADEIGRRAVLDLAEDESAEAIDLSPGSDAEDVPDEQARHRRLLQELARSADAVRGPSKDWKLRLLIDELKPLLEAGFHPIVFCRFIDTADYVAKALTDALPGVTVSAVTGQLPPAERETRVKSLADAPRRVLVATDCLSEGVNLQEWFDAVIHYDLSWNPTRHEQREGRVDRYGQSRSSVRVLTCYGRDNQIDGVVLDVLLRKHRAIRNSLGISVPVPTNTDELMDAIFEGLLLRRGKLNDDQLLLQFEEHFAPRKQALFNAWDSNAAREKRSRNVFAQETIKVGDVERELQESQAAVGSGAAVERFTGEAFGACGALVKQENGALVVDLGETPRALRDLLPPGLNHFRARFALPVKDGELVLNRTHPIVEALSSFVLDSALDPLAAPFARRCGVTRTRAVSIRTTLLLVRFRFHLLSLRTPQPLLAEECRVLAFSGAPHEAQWLPADAAEALLAATPDANIEPDQAREMLRKLLLGIEVLKPGIDAAARSRAADLLDAHKRVRAAARIRRIEQHVQFQPPADLLGVFVYLPVW